jgi:hypothetical protein
MSRTMRHTLYDMRDTLHEMHDMMLLLMASKGLKGNPGKGKGSFKGKPGPNPKAAA